MGNVFVDLQGLKDNHDFVADCCRYSENIFERRSQRHGGVCIQSEHRCGGASSCRSW